MARNNSLTKNNQPNKSQRILLNVYFDNISKKLPKQDWQYEDIKYRRNTFV